MNQALIGPEMSKLGQILNVYLNLKQVENPGAEVTDAINHLEKQIKTAILAIKVETK